VKRRVLEVIWQIASSYLLAMTHLFCVLDLWVMERVYPPQYFEQFIQIK
jgi:hypothetical protein